MSSVKEADINRPKWKWNHGELSISGTKINSQATRMAYGLAEILERLPASDEATNLSAKAWELLGYIGNYEKQQGEKP